MALIGCQPRYGQLPTRAANDLGCPESKLDIEELGAGGVRVRGCDQTVRYVCDPGFSMCVREGSVEKAASAEPTAPAPPKRKPGRRVHHFGMSVRLPPGFSLVEESKEKVVYRAPADGRGVRLATHPWVGDALAWMTAEHPSAKAKTSTLQGVSVAFATQAGEEVVNHWVATTKDGLVLEVTCSSPVANGADDKTCKELVHTLELGPPPAEE